MKKLYDLYENKSLTIEELREGYRTITGLKNDNEFTDEEIYKYMLEALQENETIKYIEIHIKNSYAICIKAEREATKEEIYTYLKEHETNAKRFDFMVEDMQINLITEKEAYNLYNMDYINTLQILK